MQEAEAEKDICWLCGKGAKQKCSACKSIYYCSRKHQKSDWKRHSNNCRRFELKTDPRLGRHYVAKRKIEVGMIVLREETPLLAWPPQDTPPVCLGCYTVLRADNSRPCENCGWPLCCSCENHDRHGECEFTMRNRGSKVMISDFEIPHPTYRSIGVIRALALRDNKPEAYRRLLKLEDHCLELSKQYGSSLDGPKEVANFVKRFFKIEDIGEEEIAKIIGILQINGHEVPTTESPHIAIYDEASYLEHNCYANCSKSFTEKGGIVIRAALPISKGDHISICYTDPLWGVTNRRHFLAQTKFFGCACERCKDPTEFGTMFNAIKCTENKCNGDMLPPTYMSSNEKSIDYACWKCKTVKTGDEVDGILNKIGMELTKIVKDDVNACKKFLNDFSGVLHVNHFYNVDVALALALIIGQQGGDLSTVSNELLNEKILLCKRLTVLLETLVPAENRMRGMLLFELHTGIAEFAKRQHPDASFNSIKESRKVLADSYQLLRHEPEILPEGKLAKQALKNLREIDAIIKTFLQKTASPA